MGDARDPADLLRLIVERAADLRKAGVLELELAGMRVKFTDHAVVDDAPTKDAAASAPAPQGWDDPEAYGLRPGAPVPGFAALRDRRKGSAT